MPVIPRLTVRGFPLVIRTSLATTSGVKVFSGRLTPCVTEQTACVDEFSRAFLCSGMLLLLST